MPAQLAAMSPTESHLKGQLIAAKPGAPSGVSADLAWSYRARRKNGPITLADDTRDYQLGNPADRAPITALTWAPDAPLVTAMDPTGTRANGPPVARSAGWQILAYIGADQP